MNRKITILSALVAFTLSSVAQISFDVRDSALWTNSSEYDYNLTSYLTNSTESNADTAFEWYVSGLDKPADWDVSVCVGELCIPNPMGSRDVNIQRGEKLDFKLGFSFWDTPGNGSAWVVVKSKSNVAIVDSFRLDVRAGTASIEKKGSVKTFDAYPNPVQNTMTITFSNGGTQSVLVYDILGSLKKSILVNSGATINLADLTKGVYIMKVEGDNSFSKVIHKL